MASLIRLPDDQNIVKYLVDNLIKEKKVGMGDGTVQMFAMMKDHEGNLRIPLATAIAIWGQFMPSIMQIPRTPFLNNIELGEGGRDYQIQTYMQTVDALIAHRTAYLSLYCGGGKTIIACKAICEFGMKTAVITDSTLIYPQWIKVLREKSNAVVVGIDTPVEKLPQADVYIFMKEAARKMHPSVLADIKFLVVDEALYFMTDTGIQAMLNFSPCYSLGLCAEIRRDDGMHCFIPHFFGNSLIRLVSSKEFTVYRVETPYKPEIKFQRFGKGPDWNLVIDSLCEMEERNKDIVHICQSNPDSRFIIGTKRKDHARKLHQMLTERGENAALLIENMRTIPQCRILIGIYSKMGKGVDVKNLCPDWEGEVFDACIIAMSIKKPEQFVGRVFRHYNPVVYDFVDDYGTLRTHFEKFRQPWYVERKGIIHRTVVQRQK